LQVMPKSALGTAHLQCLTALKVGWVMCQPRTTLSIQYMLVSTLSETFAGGLNNSAILLLAELIFIKYTDISSFADLQNSKMSSILTLSVECHCTCFITCAVTSASFRSLAAPHSEVYLALSTYWCPPYPCTKRNKHATSTP